MSYISYRGTYGNKRIRIQGKEIELYKEDMRNIEGIWFREEIEWNKEDNDVVRDMIYRYYICMCFMFMYLSSVKIEMKDEITQK